MLHYAKLFVAILLLKVKVYRLRKRRLVLSALISGHQEYPQHAWFGCKPILSGRSNVSHAVSFAALRINCYWFILSQRVRVSRVNWGNEAWARCPFSLTIATPGNQTGTRGPHSTDWSAKDHFTILLCRRKAY